MRDARKIRGEGDKEVSPTIIIIISAVISTCISKIMAERYFDITIKEIDKMLKYTEEKAKECANSILEELDRKLGLK